MCHLKKKMAFWKSRCKTTALGEKLLPYAVLLLSPVLARMSDAHPAIREAATHSFSSLLKSLPLERGIPDPFGLPADLSEARVRQRRLLEQLWNPSDVEPYRITANISASLRPYQEEGVSWLGFLVKHHLHGILCDDMGLGKTLQTIAVLASETVNRRVRYEESRLESDRPLPSLVVCPTTLVQHWCHEVRKFCTDVDAVAYTGTPRERAEIIASLRGSDKVLVISYDAVRRDLRLMLAGGLTAWNFAVLDEGHVITNPKSKTAIAVKEVGLCANHRLILSGTPIQNNVLELWGLFDFLMPSFLGSARDFRTQYSNPILASGRDLAVDRHRFTKQRSADTFGGVGAAGVDQHDDKRHVLLLEAADVALDRLHRQVLPFMLRRTKQQVLHDLPPKIITDILCPMTSLQKALYALLESPDLKDHLSSLEADEQAEVGRSSAPKVLTAMIDLKRVANHPVLVLDGDGAGRERLSKETWQQMFQEFCPGASPHDVEVAPKLKALRQLLFDCGIGDGDGDGDGEAKHDDGKSSSAGQGPSRGWESHRVLVFSQTRRMLDIIEQDLLRVRMPGVAYLRMDGTTPPHKRFGMQQGFNEDPSIQVMLLTTHVGGLGLTLTGADTVVFVDHDWNPMRDLQAMDRAHRIGQTKTVNVYRLIAQGTLEERIMGRQRFKLNVANTVVGEDNSNMKSMDASNVLDRMRADASPKHSRGVGGKLAQEEAAHKIHRGLKGVGGRAGGIESLAAGDLWDESQYAAFDVDTFVAQERKREEEREAKIQARHSDPEP